MLERLLRYALRLAFRFQRTHGVDVTGNKFVMIRLLEAWKRAWNEVRTEAKTEIDLPFLASDESGPKHFRGTFTREEMDGFARSVAADLLPPEPPADEEPAGEPRSLWRKLLG